MACLFITSLKQHIYYLILMSFIDFIGMGAAYGILLHRLLIFFGAVDVLNGVWKLKKVMVGKQVHETS